MASSRRGMEQHIWIWMQSFVYPHLACHLPTIPDLLQRHGHYGTHSQVTTHHVHIQKKHVAEIQRQFVSLLFVVPCVPKATHMSNLCFTSFQVCKMVPSAISWHWSWTHTWIISTRQSVFLSKVLLVPLDLPQKVVPAHVSRNSSVSNLCNYAL